jgi:hypothetical protein
MLAIMDGRPEVPPNDPLGLERVDSEIRIEKLRQEIQDVTGEESLHGKAENCAPELEEAFLEQVLALETHGFVCPFDVLATEGVSLPPPEELDEASLPKKLQELIDELAKRRLFLERTDHLSDRELYSWLWKNALREELMGFGMPFGNCHLDVLGGCSEEDLILGMRYYADPEERARWAKEFPDFPMPPSEKPPFDRDRRLPKSEYPCC